MVSAQASPRERKPALRSAIVGEGVQQVAGRAGQAVEPGHHEHVAGGELGEHPAELRPVGLGSARGLAEHLAGAGRPELAHLGVNALAVGRNSCIPVNHGVQSAPIYATEKPFVFSALILVQNS